MTDPDHPLMAVYREHSGPVHRVAVLICGERLAADVTHDVFIDLWHKPEIFEPASGTMRSHLVASAWRRANRLRPAARDREAAARSLMALEQLPAPERDAIVIACYGGCTYRETAIVLGEPEDAIRARVTAGLRQLRGDLVGSAS